MSHHNIQVEGVDSELLNVDNKTVIVYVGSNLKKLENYGLIFKGDYYKITYTAKSNL